MRRFPPPWTIDEANDACFIVRDNTGQALAYIYFEDEPGRRSTAKLLTRDVLFGAEYINWLNYMLKVVKDSHQRIRAQFLCANI